jgi:dGTPase
MTSFTWPPDVEDAVKKGVLSWRQVRESLTSTPAASVTSALAFQERILKAGRSRIPSDLDDDTWASAFRTAAIKVMVDAALKVFQKRYDAMMKGEYEGALVPDSQAAELAKRLRKIGTTWVYPTRSTLTLELMGHQVIGDLMDVFWEGAAVLPRKGLPKTSDFSGKAAALFSRNYRAVFQRFVANKPTLPETYHRFQLVTDYICGMTDSFAKRLHAELFNGR